MRFAQDDQGAEMVEAIAYVVVALACAGAAVSAVYLAVAGKLNAIASLLK